MSLLSDINFRTPDASRTLDIGLMLNQRLRRWPKIKPTSVQRLVFAGSPHTAGFQIIHCVDDQLILQTAERAHPRP